MYICVIIIIIYNRFMQLNIGSIIRVYYRVVSLYLIRTSQILKQIINKVFYRFDEIKVPLCLDDTSPRCTSTAKDTTENALL